MYQTNELMALIENEKIDLCMLPMRGKLKGLYADNVIAISNEVKTASEFACVVAEELGHYYTSHGNILDQMSMTNQKQELRARKWAHEKLIMVEDLLNAYLSGVSSRFELAEFLNVTEPFLIEAIACFSEKYGPFKKIGDYILYFEPLGVLEIWPDRNMLGLIVDGESI